MISERSVLIPVRDGGKTPLVKQWNILSVENSKALKSSFTNCNWGLLLGHEETHYIDLDIEKDEVYKKISVMKTLEFGRESRGFTGHYLYSCKDASDKKNVQYYSKNKELLMELRCQGLVTLPPSRYIEEGVSDIIGYEGEADIQEVEYQRTKDMLFSFHISYIINEMYPVEGSRQEVIMGVTAFLLKNKINRDLVLEIFDKVFEWSKDNEESKRRDAVISTIDKYEKGSLVSGYQILKKYYDTTDLQFLLEAIKNLSNSSDSESNEKVVEFFNDQYVFINHPKGIWDLKYNLYTDLRALKTHYAHKTQLTIVEEKLKRIPWVDIWMFSVEKMIKETVEYAPGESDPNKVNMWKGWGVAPRDYEISDLSPMLHMLEYLFERTNSDGQRITDASSLCWFLDWLAYPLQNPGKKNHTAVLLCSNHQGVGKNMIGYVMHDIYGENYVQVGEKAFERDFDDSLMCRQFVVGNELTSGDRFGGLEKLKILITEPYIEINRKFQPIITVKNCLNILLISNNPDPIVIKEKDRRFFVWEINNPPLGESFFQSIFIPWKENGGSAKFFRFLLDRDLSKYSAQGHAPETEAKLEMRDNQKSLLENMILEKLLDPEFPDIIVSATLHKMFYEETGLRLTPIQIGKAMFHLRNSCKRRLSIGKGVQIMAWAIKNVSCWSKAPSREWQTYIYRQHTTGIFFKRTQEGNEKSLDTKEKTI